MTFVVIVYSKWTKIHSRVGRAGLLNDSTQGFARHIRFTDQVWFFSTLKFKDLDEQQGLDSLIWGPGDAETLHLPTIALT